MEVVLKQVGQGEMKNQIKNGRNGNREIYIKETRV